MFMFTFLFFIWSGIVFMIWNHYWCFQIKITKVGWQNGIPNPLQYFKTESYWEDVKPFVSKPPFSVIWGRLVKIPYFSPAAMMSRSWEAVKSPRLEGRALDTDWVELPAWAWDTGWEVAWVVLVWVLLLEQIPVKVYYPSGHLVRQPIFPVIEYCPSGHL